MENKTLGTFIAFLRKEKRLTQKQLAELLNVSDKTVSHWECDETSPDISLLPLLAETLGVTVDELLKGEKAAPQPTVEHHYIPPKGESVIDKAEQLASRTVNKIKESANSDIAERYKYFRILSLVGTIISCVVLARVGFSTASGSSFGTYVNFMFMPGFIALFGSLWTIAISLGFTISARFFFSKELLPRDGADKKEKEYIYKANFFTYNNIFLVLCILPLPLIGIDVFPLLANALAVLIFIAAARILLTALLTKKGILRTSKKKMLMIKYICICFALLAFGIATGLFIQEFWYPAPENIIFENAEEFIIYMETPAEKPENAYIIDGVEMTTYPPTMPAPGHTSPTDSPVQSLPSADEEEIGETVMGYCGKDYVTFMWLNKAVYDFAYNEEEGTFHVITYEAKITSERQFDMRDDVLAVIVPCYCMPVVLICFVLYKRKVKILSEK